MNNSVPIKARKSTSSWVRMSRHKPLQGLTIPPRHDYKYATSLILFVIMAGTLVVNIASVVTGDTKLVSAHSPVRPSRGYELTVTSDRADPGTSVNNTNTDPSLGSGQAGSVAPISDVPLPVVTPAPAPSSTPAEPITKAPQPAAPAPAVTSPPAVSPQVSPKVTSTTAQTPQVTAPIAPLAYVVPDTVTTTEPTTDKTTPVPAIAQMASAQAVEATSPVTYTSARISNTARDKLLVTAGVAILASIAMYILATLSNPTNTARFNGSLRIRTPAREVVRS